MSSLSDQILSGCLERASDSSGAQLIQPLLLDKDQLTRRCMGSAALANQLLDSFEARFPAEMAAIEACLAAKDIPKAILLVHQLRGAAANVSSPLLANLLSGCEELLRAGCAEQLPFYIVELHTAWNRFAQFRRNQN